MIQRTPKYLSPRFANRYFPFFHFLCVLCICMQDMCHIHAQVSMYARMTWSGGVAHVERPKVDTGIMVHCPPILLRQGVSVKPRAPRYGDPRLCLPRLELEAGSHAQLLSRDLNSDPHAVSWTIESPFSPSCYYLTVFSQSAQCIFPK